MILFHAGIIFGILSSSIYAVVSGARWPWPFALFLASIGALISAGDALKDKDKRDQ